MRSEDKQATQLILQAIAAKASLLAMKVERGQLWPGDLQSGVGELRKLLNDLPEQR
jgi:hypothetical protein